MVCTSSLTHSSAIASRGARIEKVRESKWSRLLFTQMFGWNVSDDYENVEVCTSNVKYG